MVIKRRDGSIYRVSHPNPIMTQQDCWLDDILTTHNFENQDIIKLDSQKTKPTPEEPKPEPKVDMLKAFEEKYAKEELKIQKAAEEKIEFKVEPPKPKSVGQSLFYCLPAKMLYIRDNVYDDEIVRIQYLAPFTFTCKVLPSNNINFIIQTEQKLTESSIIFDRERRQWWKIVKAEGDTYTSVPSDIKPEF